MRVRRRSSRGFTILEILISIVVLVLGITGIVAIFPAAMNTGKLSVDDSYAAAIALSVADALNAGIRDVRGSGTQYFIFNHDGVLDGPPVDAGNWTTGGFGNTHLARQDCTVVLPQGDNVLMYPVPDNQDGGGPLDMRARINQRESGQVDNFSAGLQRTTVDGTPFLWISRTYALGRFRDGGAGTKGEIRDEYRVADLNPGIAATDRLIMADNYCTYSFAFAVARGRYDNTSGAAAKRDGLYETRIMVFKNFDTEAAAQLAPMNGSLAPTGGAAVALPESNVPIHTFITLLTP